MATVVRMMTPHSSWCHTRLGVQHAIRLIVTSRGRPDALLDEGAMPVRGCTRVAWERDAAAWLLGDHPCFPRGYLTASLHRQYRESGNGIGPAFSMCQLYDVRRALVLPRACTPPSHRVLCSSRKRNAAV